MGHWVDAGSQGLQAGKGNSGKHFANYAEERYPSIVVAVASVFLVFTQGDYVGVAMS